MFRFAGKWAPFVCALALVLAGTTPAAANIIRVSGPNTVINEPEGLIKFDVAFDSVNQVYLVVWGTQTTNAKGQFLNANGQPLGAPFTIQALSGWIRVTYSVQQQKFMVGYTRITFWPPAGSTLPPQHQRFARFIGLNPGDNTPAIGPEIFLDAVGSSPGNSTGVAYSPAYGVFFATWYKYVQVPDGDWSVPRSYVAAIAPNGTVLAVNELTNPSLGQSDPNIACSNSGRCLVVGFGWNNATWGRLIDGPLGTPVGGGSWDIAVTPNDSKGNPVGTLGDGTVAYSETQDKFVVLYVRNFNTIWGNTVGLDGTATAPYVVLRSTPETESLVGPGYGVPNLAFNTGTNSFLVSGRDYLGRTDGQEADSTGLPIAGSWDQLPPAGESEYAITAADGVNRHMALFDNQNFNSIRIALYEIGDPRLLNGDFNSGMNNWFAWASSGQGDIVTTVQGGVLKFHKNVPAGGGTNSAAVYNDTLLSFASGTHLRARFDLGNSSGVPKSINVMLHTNFDDLKVCTFNLPANSPLRTYQIRALTSMGWGRASILFEAVTPGETGEDYLLDNVTLQAAPSQTNTGTECSGPLSASGDSNGDGKHDILWQHTSGSVSIWLMDGLGAIGGGSVLGGGTGWSVKLVGDFNGDGKQDLLWQHTGGSLSMWLMDGVGVIGGGSLAGPGAGWTPVQLADLNGDGKSDIIWQNTDGSVSIWLMDGIGVIGSGNVLGAGTGWSVKLVGDFNGDGKADILWQHTGGSVSMWLMDGLGVIGGGTVLGSATGWAPVQLADLNGDGKSDIVWQHTGGSVSIWLMNGINVVGGGNVLGGGTGWSVKLVGDFNGDGKGDILWQHTGGSVSIWLLDGAGVIGGGGVLGGGTGWSVKLVGDFNGDGKSDILWQHTDGSVALWLMNGATQVGGANLIGAGTGWSPVAP